MNQKKVGFLRASVLYHALLAIVYVIARRRFTDIQMELIQTYKYDLLFLVSGGFFCLFGLRKIVYHEFIYRPGRRLLAKEAQLKNEGIDFDHIRQEDDA